MTLHIYAYTFELTRSLEFFSLFSSNMHSAAYNGANMSSMAAMHHSSNSHGLQQQQQQHESNGGQQHNNSSGNNNNNGSSAAADTKTLSPPPINSGAGSYASYFGQLAANSVMDNVMCRPVH